jgi:excisionase family DNA binding protein
MPEDACEPEESLLTTTEAATRLGVTAGTVALWCREGRLAAVKTEGGQWRIPASVVEEAAQRGSGGWLYGVAQGVLVGGNCCVILVCLFWLIVILWVLVVVLRA